MISGSLKLTCNLLTV